MPRITLLCSRGTFIKEGCLYSGCVRLGFRNAEAIKVFPNTFLEIYVFRQIMQLIICIMIKL